MLSTFIAMLIMVRIAHTFGSEVSEPLKCPEESLKVIDPKNGVGTMSCKGSEACAKLSTVSCIGHRIYKQDKCYRWECNGIPTSLDSLTDVNIKGPAYDEIEITVTQTPAVAVFVAIFLMAILFMLDPSFAFGAIFGAALAGGDNKSRSFES